jgi:hypothetical protein
MAGLKRALPKGGKRISIDEAVRKLMPALGRDGAVEFINTAIRDRKRARLFCDGNVVDPNFIRDHLVVTVRKGRRAVEIEATRALDKPESSYTWQMDANEIEALRPAAFALTRSPAKPPADDDAKGRRAPGKPPAHNWPMVMARELIRRAQAGETMPKAPELLQWCQDQWNWEPDIRQMQRLLRDLLS